jgi:hypothetical protein
MGDSEGYSSWACYPEFCLFPVLEFLMRGQPRIRTCKNEPVGALLICLYNHWEMTCFSSSIVSWCYLYWERVAALIRISRLGTRTGVGLCQKEDQVQVFVQVQSMSSNISCWLLGAVSVGLNLEPLLSDF